MKGPFSYNNLNKENQNQPALINIFKKIKIKIKQQRSFDGATVLLTEAARKPRPIY